MTLFNEIPRKHILTQNLAAEQSETETVGKELRRYIETAGFYAWLFRRKFSHSIYVEEPDAVAFMDACNEWRNLSHYTIAYWVNDGKELQYTPTSTPPYHQPTQITVDYTNNSETNAFPELSLQKIFSDCTPEILEASVDLGVNLLEQLKKPLRHLSPDIDAVDWLNSIENLQKQTLPPKTIVGVVGNIGGGKSSVIHAMLDEERLVPTNSMRACTAVVTEISYNHDKVSYRAEVEFINLLDAHGNVTTEAWRQETEASIAYAKIKAVYPEYTKDMLQKSSVTRLLEHSKVQELLGGKKEIFEFDPAQLYQKLQSYVDSKEKTAGKKELEVWPLIKVVRIYVKAACLSTGAVIVDLPGVHDSNAARAAVAEGYMKQCTGLWIVAPITRAVDDKAAKSLLGDTFKRQLKMDGKLDSVSSICSKTDDISILECQESLDLEAQMSALWMRSKEYSTMKQRCEEQLDMLKETKAEYIATLDHIDEQIEAWEGFKETIENGNKVFAPGNKLPCRKRRRNRNSNASGSPQKKHRPSISDSEGDHADTGSESELDDEEGDDSGQPLTLEVVEEKLTELKANKRESRLHRQKIDAEMKLSRKEISKIKEKETNTKAEMSAMAISARNEYSREPIQQDFAAGIEELDHELAEEVDASNFNPEIDVRDYDEVAKALPVFCVSSRAYQKLQGRFQKEAHVPGFQTIEETEIPQLQAHCKRLTEASRKRNCQRFLNGVDQFFNSLRLILSPEGIQVTAEQKIARAAIVEDEYKAFDKELEKYLKSTCQHIVKEIEGDISQVCDKAINITRKQANKTVRSWGAPTNDLDRPAGGLKWATYKALCRRNGVYSNGQDGHNWNAELIEPVIKAVAPNWEKVFSRGLHDVLKRAAKESASLLESFHNNVSVKISQETGPLESSHMLSQQIPLYQQILNDIFSRQILEVREKSKDTSRMFEPVIAETLSPVYEVCVEESGRAPAILNVFDCFLTALISIGSFMRMKEAMSTFVHQARDTMFHQSVDAVRKALNEMCQSLEEALLSQIEKVIISLKRDYMSAVHRGVLSKEKRDILKDVLETITESESSFRKLAIPFKEM
ncbi:hypothetical protein UA08_00258 [Talaromyces atroroseus]|uniref:GED domain-containing protein n=1 Tax=Talaromyces atroroseus TaxID=1441469 RepID=A0A225AWB4_TALAT|nr:hypothetical protein UA08_00258 [Talaromyces atroroseus]OKL63903.1 hypothetical protein UA08_00258 [Talaromyces atroroseus]